MKLNWLSTRIRQSNLGICSMPVYQINHPLNKTEVKMPKPQSLRDKLEELQRSKQILAFVYCEAMLDETDREVDRLEITFPSGETLNIQTFCSGCGEGSSLYLKD